MNLSKPISDRGAWMRYALAKLKTALVYEPYLWFTAESFVDKEIPPHCKPADPRWVGLVVQQAAREKVIKRVMIKRTFPLCSLTRAGHRTSVWRAV